MTTWLGDAAEALDRGRFCYLAVRTPRGPHLTPVVFALYGKRLWVTTARRSVKARAWKASPVVGGLIHWRGGSVGLVGSVRTYDGLDPSTWGAMVRAGPSLGLAASAFTRKNARFFAGYAVDARHVPLAWTPPGRVFAAISIHDAYRFDARGLRGGGQRGMMLPLTPATSFRRGAVDVGPLATLPPEVVRQVGTRGHAALAIDGTVRGRPRAGAGLRTVGAAEAPLVAPVRWTESGGTVYAALDLAAARAAGGGPDVAVALTADHASAWRARAMAGIMIRGVARIVVPEELRSGRATAEAILAEMDADPRRTALLRVDAYRLVWWRGWASGTVALS